MRSELRDAPGGIRLHPAVLNLSFAETFQVTVARRL
jgi:hypothetical protein